MQTAAELLEAYGATDPIGLVGRVLQRHRGRVRKIDKTYQHDEDLEAYLLLQLCGLALRYDPAKDRNPGPTAFTSYACRILDMRIADYFRERDGDNRTHTKHREQIKVFEVALDTVHGNTNPDDTSVLDFIADPTDPYRDVDFLASLQAA